LLTYKGLTFGLILHPHRHPHRAGRLDGEGWRRYCTSGAGIRMRPAPRRRSMSPRCGGQPHAARSPSTQELWDAGDAARKVHDPAVDGLLLPDGFLADLARGGELALLDQPVDGGPGEAGLLEDGGQGNDVHGSVSPWNRLGVRVWQQLPVLVARMGRSAGGLWECFVAGPRDASASEGEREGSGSVG
jgi:hypothetical protein